MRYIADAEQATCSVDECESPTTARGWCNRHYKRWRSHGSPTETVTRPREATLPEAFAWHQTTERPAEGCWDWSGATLDEDGYGTFSYGSGAPMRAHRASYLIHKGEIPDGMMVRHTCDRRCCIQPDHLILGTNLQNMQDMVERGRAVSGVRHPNSKLNPEKVREIRRRHASGESQKSLARAFGVSDNAIGRVVKMITWRDA